MATLLSTMNISYSISKRDSHFSQNAKAHFSNDSWKLKIVKDFKEIKLQRGQTHENFVLKRIIRMEYWAMNEERPKRLEQIMPGLK